jgi:membrane glycosyltransferase
VAGVSSSTSNRLLADGSSAGAALTVGYHVGFLVAAAAVVGALLLAAILLRSPSERRTSHVLVHVAARSQADNSVAHAPSWATLGSDPGADLVVIAAAAEPDRQEAAVA